MAAQKKRKIAARTTAAHGSHSTQRAWSIPRPHQEASTAPLTESAGRFSNTAARSRLSASVFALSYADSPGLDAAILRRISDESLRGVSPTAAWRAVVIAATVASAPYRLGSTEGTT